MRFQFLVETSGAVAATRARREKIERLAALLTRLASEEVPVAVGLKITTAALPLPAM